MSFDHMLNEICYVENAVIEDGAVKLDGDGEVVYDGVLVKTPCMHMRKQRVFRTQGSTGNAGERISEHLIVTSTEIHEDARVWIPGKDQTNVNQSLTIGGLESQARPYGGLIQYKTFL